MKLAVTGKGGVGKSTVAGALALLAAKKGGRVLALDADPDANLANALGAGGDIKITPISKQIGLIEERTGAKVSEYGKVFKLNPEVSDVADRFAVKINGVDLVVLGAASRGGGGCACPENAFLKALVADMVLYKNETLIMDMEAGVEHLGRATASGVDAVVVVVEPGGRSVECAATIARMGNEIGIKKFIYVANKVASAEDAKFLRESLGFSPAASIPWSDSIRRADRPGACVLDFADKKLTENFEAILAAATGA